MDSISCHDDGERRRRRLKKIEVRHATVETGSCDRNHQGTACVQPGVHLSRLSYRAVTRQHATCALPAVARVAVVCAVCPLGLWWRETKCISLPTIGIPTNWNTHKHLDTVACACGEMRRTRSALTRCICMCRDAWDHARADVSPLAPLSQPSSTHHYCLHTHLRHLAHSRVACGWILERILYFPPPRQ